MKKAQDRLEILERIKQCEINEEWDKDIENDPPALELLPKDIDYLNKKLSNKIKSWFANLMATKFFENLIKNKQFIIKDIKGIENFLSVKGGAIITSNHFSPLENYAVWRSIKPYMKGKNLYRVIKEGNYTNPPPPFKLFMQHCNTLPLSRNRETMKLFLKSIDTLLSRGEKILVYPEQSMWWNYKKPRPFKPGAFSFAVSSSVPVVPMFITMTDSDNLEPNGFYTQEYTVHILKPIYPQKNLSKQENIEYMKNENYNAWVKVYEEFYGKKLEFLTEKQ